VFVTDICECHLTQAMQQVKEIVEFATNHPHTDNLQNVQKVFAKTVQSEEARYGMMSFLSKQKPDWSSFVSKL
jgi:microcystin degradation protein MlrC